MMPSEPSPPVVESLEPVKKYRRSPWALGAIIAAVLTVLKIIQTVFSAVFSIQKEPISFSMDRVWSGLAITATTFIGSWLFSTLFVWLFRKAGRSTPKLLGVVALLLLLLFGVPCIMLSLALVASGR